MNPLAPASGQAVAPAPRYPRPSRLRRTGALALTMGGLAAVACGGGGGGSSAPAQSEADVWVETDGAAGRINLDDVQQAYRDAYASDGFKVEAFEQRVNEIYEGDKIVLIQAVREGEQMVITGWEDLDDSKQVDAAQDDKLFTITQDLRENGNYQTQGHGANGYYNQSSPFGGFFTGLLIGNLLSGGRTTYVTSPGRYDTLSGARGNYRNGGDFTRQRERNAAYGGSVNNRFGANAGTQTVSPARRSYQTRQINSGGFRSTGTGSRSIGSGRTGGTGGAGGITGGGGLLRR